MQIISKTIIAEEVVTIEAWIRIIETDLEL